MTFKTALDQALDPASITGTTDDPTYKKDEIVFIKADYKLGTGKNTNYVLTPYQVVHIITKWDGTIIEDKNAIQADGDTGGSEAKMYFYKIQNESGAPFEFHQSELIKITAVRTEVSTNITTDWDDAFTLAT